MKLNCEHKHKTFSRLARSIRGACLVLVTLLALGAPRIDAAGNHLVQSFGTNGKVLFRRTSSSTDTANAAFNAFSDGKFYVAGSSDSGEADFLLLRFNGNGTLDTTFNIIGYTTTEFGSNDTAYALGVQSDDKIVVVGGSGNSWAVARYNTNGALDPTFSGDGKHTFVFEGYVGPPHSVSLSGGKILIAGTVRSLATNSLAWGFARLNSDGSFDTTFDADGKKHHEFGGFGASLSKAITQPDGKILGVGSLGISSRNFLIARFNSDGTFDSTFDNEGIVTTDFNGWDDIATRIRLTSSNKYIVSGTTRPGDVTTYRVALARYNLDGSPDTTFSGDGKVVHDFLIDGFDGVVDMIHASGKTNVLGYTANFEAFSLYRFEDDGGRDMTFGTGGRVNTVFGVGSSQEIDTIPAALFSTSGETVIVAGRYQNSIAIARIKTEGIAMPSDFTGDGNSELTVFRPSEGNWYALNPRTLSHTSTHWGQAGDIPAPGDYDGDGRADQTVYRNGVWYILRSSDGNFAISQFGLSGDKPVPGDYDGDGVTDVAVYRPSSGVWHLLRTSQGYTAASFGLSEDRPVPGDYDGDGLTDLAVFRPSTGVWYMLRSITGFAAIQFGLAEDRPVPGDYDGDGRTDIVVFRPSTGVWHFLISSHNLVYASFHFGLGTDIPAPIIADGRSAIAVFRPSTGVWYASDIASTVAIPWGTNGDIPIPSGFVSQ